MESLKKKWQSSTILSPNKLELPKPERDFAMAHDHASREDWAQVSVNALLLNLTTHDYAIAHAAKLEKLGLDYHEVVNAQGEFQRAFATIENPLKKGDYRLFEIPYQYFDSDKKNGHTVPDSTGFKMCAAVEHILPNHSKAEADKIIEQISKFDDPAVQRNLHRDLVKDKDGKVVQTWAFGGWTLEVGGGYNAYEIEHGRNPIQWENMLGLHGKPKALDEAIASMDRIGVPLHPSAGKAGSTIEITGDSMGTPNAQMAKYLLETQHGQQHVPLMNMVPMAQGQTLKQLTEIEYNRLHKGDYFVPLSELKGAQQQEAERIAERIHDSASQTTVYASNNYFAHYNVNGNSSLSSAPGLAGDKMLLLKSEPYPSYLPSYFKDGVLDQGFRIKYDHLLPAFNQKMTLGPTELTPAIYEPKDHSLHDVLFTERHEEKNVVESKLITVLHTFNELHDDLTYGFNPKDPNYRQGRAELTTHDIASALPAPSLVETPEHKVAAGLIHKQNPQQMSR